MGGGSSWDTGEDEEQRMDGLWAGAQRWELAGVAEVGRKESQVGLAKAGAVDLVLNVIESVGSEEGGTWSDLRFKRMPLATWRGRLLVGQKSWPCILWASVNSATRTASTSEGHADLGWPVCVSFEVHVCELNVQPSSSGSQGKKGLLRT